MTAGVPVDDVDGKKLEILDYLTSNDFATFTNACKKVGISRSLGYRWREDDQVFDAAVKRAVREAHESLGDLAESKLASIIKQGENDAVIKWYLETQHRDRGYIKRTEQDHGLRKDGLNEEDKDIAARFAAAMLAGLNEAGREDG